MQKKDFKIALAHNQKRSKNVKYLLKLIYTE